MIYEVDDQSNMRRFFLVDFPEELKVVVEEPEKYITSDGETHVVSTGSQKPTSNLYEYYKSIFNNVGKFGEVTFTLVEEVPYEAKRYRYHPCSI